MRAVILMLGVTICYTISSCSDKYAVSVAKFTKDEFTFLMCSSMSILLLITLPFQSLYFSACWQTFAAMALVTLCKFLEFQMSALVLKQLTAFELKAWLGVTLFVSYITDVFYGEELRIMPLVCIAVTAVGLMFIAKSGKQNKVEYRVILVPLILYLAAKFGYGLTIKAFTPFSAPTLQLLPALAAISAIMMFKIKPQDLIKKNKKGALAVILARIPNTLGMLLENAVISISLSCYSFIQPMILILLFFIGIVKKESISRANIIGGIICISGVILYQVS